MFSVSQAININISWMMKDTPWVKKPPEKLSWPTESNTTV
jgi:hypothetical protein